MMRAIIARVLAPRLAPAAAGQLRRRDRAAVAVRAAVALVEERRDAAA